MERFLRFPDNTINTKFEYSLVKLNNTKKYDKNLKKLNKMKWLLTAQTEMDALFNVNGQIQNYIVPIPKIHEYIAGILEQNYHLRENNNNNFYKIKKLKTRIQRYKLALKTIILSILLYGAWKFS